MLWWGEWESGGWGVGPLPPIGVDRDQVMQPPFSLFTQCVYTFNNKFKAVKKVTKAISQGHGAFLKGHLRNKLVSY